MRIDLPDGQWAELRERISHGQSKRITEALKGDDYAFTDQLVREFVRDWHVLDIDGEPITLGDGDAIDRMPQETFDSIFAGIVEVRRGRLDGAPTPPSSDA